MAMDEAANPVEEGAENTEEAAEDTLEALRRDMESGFERIENRILAMEADFSERTAFQPKTDNQVVNNTAQTEQQVQVDDQHDAYLRELKPTRKHGIFHTVHR